MRLIPFPRRQILTGLVCASVMVASFAEAAIPRQQSTVSDWAAKTRIVSAESGSRFPGKWDPNRVPYLNAIMDACGPQDASQIVAIIGSAQSGKSEVPLNAIGRTIEEDPMGILAVLPIHNEASKWSEIKLEPMISATPELARRVYSRHGEKRSSQTRKKFRDGFLQIGSANATPNLQMITVGLIICEEISEWPLPDPEEERGDPFEQAQARGITYGEALKTIVPSTPGKIGTCRVTQLYDQGDQRRWAWNCPHCDDWFIPRFAHLTRSGSGTTARVDLAPPCCGALIGHSHKTTMNLAGRWVPTFTSANPDNPAPASKPDPKDPTDTRIADVIPAADIDAACARDCEGRDKSFHIWQGISPFSTWTIIHRKYREAKGDPAKMIAFTQQVLGEAYDAEMDTPDDEKLLEMAGGAPNIKTSPVRRSIVPPWAGFTTVAADLQGDRFEWAAYAWGPGPRGACIDHDIIDTSPMLPAGWRDLRAAFAREYASPHLRPQIARRMGTDTGGHDTQYAYRFINGNPDVIGLKGATGPKARFEPLHQKSRKGGRLKTPDGRTAQRVPLTIINTHLLKKYVYTGLSNSLTAFENGEVGEGLHLFFHDEIDAEFTKQLTAESLIVDKVKNHESWVRNHSRANEQLDLAGYNLLLAIHFGLFKMDTDAWERLFLREASDPATMDLTPLELLAREEDIAPAPLPRQSDKDAGDGPVIPDWMQRLMAMNKGSSQTPTSGGSA